MKVLTYILAFTVIILSVKPGIDAIPFSSETKQSCCSGNQCWPISGNQNSENHDDKEDNKMCNLFQACGSCLLICASAPSYSIQQAEISTKQSFSYQSFIAFQFISDFWHPPQLV